MTAQVGDRFIYKEDNYSIVAISNPIPVSYTHLTLPTIA